MKITIQNEQFDMRFRYTDVYWIPDKHTGQFRWMEYDDAIENTHFSGDLYATKVAFADLFRSKKIVCSKKTECIISRVLENKTGRERYEEVSHESVIWNTQKDKYSKGKGRKEAFAKAVNNLTEDRVTRLFFWREFFANINDQKQYLPNVDFKIACLASKVWREDLAMAEFTKLPDNWEEIVEKNCTFARYKQERGYDD